MKILQKTLFLSVAAAVAGSMLLPATAQAAPTPITKAVSVQPRVSNSAFGQWFVNAARTHVFVINGQSTNGMCLRNVYQVAESYGVVINYQNSNTAADKLKQIKKRSKQTHELNAVKNGKTPPKGSLIWWGSNVGGGVGYVAVSDGRGNFINNWSVGYIEKVKLSAMPVKPAGWTYLSSISR